MFEVVELLRAEYLPTWIITILHLKYETLINKGLFIYKFIKLYQGGPAFRFSEPVFNRAGVLGCFLVIAFCHEETFCLGMRERRY